MRGSLAIALFATACAGRAMPCASPSCESGMECLANRCVKAGSDPVAANTERVVLEAISVGAPGAESRAEPSVAIGGKQSALYLGFDTRPEANAHVLAAFLLLEPLENDPPTQSDVPLTVWTTATPWSPESVRSGTAPTLTLPRAEGFARTTPAAVVRIDVTELAKTLLRGSVATGLAVIAERNSELVLSTSAAGHAPPRLELYIQRPSR